MTITHEPPRDQDVDDSQISAVAGDLLPVGQRHTGAHSGRADRDTLPRDQRECVAHARTVAGNHTPTAAPATTAPMTIPPQSEPSSPDARPDADSIDRSRPGSTDQPAGSSKFSLPKSEAPRLVDPLLFLLADNLDDLERLRTASANRLSQLTRTGEDKDGEERGFGLPENAPVVVVQRGIVEALEAQEHAAELALRRAMRAHPLGAWQKNTLGVGEKQLARLLSTIAGDPYWNHRDNRPRTVSELWAYCGLHVNDGKAARRTRGQQSNWSTNAKTRVWLIAVSCMKQRQSPYRLVYDDRREHTAVAHPEWTDGHSHADALRVVSKAILKDLWIAARDIHCA